MEKRLSEKTQSKTLGGGVYTISAATARLLVDKYLQLIKQRGVPLRSINAHETPSQILVPDSTAKGEK